MDQLPLETRWQICELLDRKALKAFSLVSRDLRGAALPSLFRTTKYERPGRIPNKEGELPVPSTLALVHDLLGSSRSVQPHIRDFTISREIPADMRSEEYDSMGTLYAILSSLPALRTLTLDWLYFDPREIPDGGSHVAQPAIRHLECLNLNDIEASHIPDILNMVGTIDKLAIDDSDMPGGCGPRKLTPPVPSSPSDCIFHNLELSNSTIARHLQPLTRFNNLRSLELTELYPQDYPWLADLLSQAILSLLKRIDLTVATREPRPHLDVPLLEDYPPHFAPAPLLRMAPTLTSVSLSMTAYTKVYTSYDDRRTVYDGDVRFYTHAYTYLHEIVTALPDSVRTLTITISRTYADSDSEGRLQEDWATLDIALAAWIARGDLRTVTFIIYGWERIYVEGMFMCNLLRMCNAAGREYLIEGAFDFSFMSRGTS